MESADWGAYEAAIDDAIATCDGDLRGALKALIIANEHLERDLHEALAMLQHPRLPTIGPMGRCRWTGWKYEG
jgi:hypothetical protein